MAIDLHNWAGNYQYSAARLHRPETIDQLQELVARSSKVKVIGSRHSFNGITDTIEDLVCLDRWDNVISLDRKRRTVTIEAGIRYGPLCKYLHSQGFALHNLASLTGITVAGACSTGTHGSGVRNANLATAVTAIELITADGEIKTLPREHDQFQGAVVGLGGLGLITKLTLDLVPTFDVRQDVYVDLPLTQVEEHFEEIMSSAYSVSLFTDWRSPSFTQAWRKHRISDGAVADPEQSWFGATPAPGTLHPISGLPIESCTEQGGIPGPWHERLPHFRYEKTPSSGDELQSEYFVPRRQAVDALRALMGLSDRIAPLVQVSEIRTIAADTLWMSTCYQRDSVSLHFTWHPDWPGVSALLPQIEARLSPFEPRPHWGKLYTMGASQLDLHYQRLPDFRNLLTAFDPAGKFRNAFLDAYIFGGM